MSLILKGRFWAKCEFIIYNKASSKENIHSLLSSHIKIHRHICLQQFWNVFTYKQCLICAYFSPDSDKTTFSFAESNIRYCNGLKLKTSKWWIYYKCTAFHFTRCLLMDWSHVDCLWIIVMFLSVVWILILTAPIHCRGSIGEQVM